MGVGRCALCVDLADTVDRTLKAERRPGSCCLSHEQHIRLFGCLVRTKFKMDYEKGLNASKIRGNVSLPTSEEVGHSSARQEGQKREKRNERHCILRPAKFHLSSDPSSRSQDV